MVDVTFVVPFFNEEKDLPGTLESLVGQDLGKYSAEILLVDGNSTDGSRGIAERCAGQNGDQAKAFKVLSNPGRRTPLSFNLGIAEARAPVVGFGGAHTHYPKDFLRTAVELLESHEADVVGGGHDEFVPAHAGVLSAAMACLYESPFGSGAAAYHRSAEPAYVDTCYGGFYRKSVFESVGVFNERLSRNQDNELNARVTQAGFKILFHPALSTTYVFKGGLRAFLKRGFLFGFYHPETWGANPGAFRWRHCAPMALVAYLLAAPPVCAVTHSVLPLAPLVIYLLMLGVAGITLSLRRSVPVGLVAMGCFCAYHLSYGVGTLCGGVRLIARVTSRRPHEALRQERS